jgi:hypothetical protein
MALSERGPGWTASKRLDGKVAVVIARVKAGGANFIRGVSLLVDGGRMLDRI